MADPFDLPEIGAVKNLSPAGKDAYVKYVNGVDAAAATINGQKTGINSDADVERAIMDMVGVKGITATYPEDIKSVALGKDAEFQAIKIKAMKPEDVKALVEGLKKEGLEVIHKHDDKTGIDTIVLKTAEMTDKLMPKMKAEFEKLGKDNPDLIRSMQKDSKSREPDFQSPKEQVAAGKTIPAEAVKVGQIGQGRQAALKVGKDHGETIRGDADFKIMRDKDGKLTAMVDLGYGEPQLLKSTDTVKQQITATIDGVDGKPPKKVTFDVGKDGTLAEVKGPAATPQGKEQGGAGKGMQ